MKVNKPTLTLLGIGVVLTTQAFTLPKTETRTSMVNDSLKTKQILKTVVFDQPVQYKYVQPCLDAFAKSGLKPGITVTESVEFSKADLQLWLDTLSAQTEYTHMRVCFGLYTKEFLKHYEVKNPKEMLNRLTVFLVPFKNDAVAVYKAGKGHTDGNAGSDSTAVDSFNLGNVRP